MGLNVFQFMYILYFNILDFPTSLYALLSLGCSLYGWCLYNNFPILELVETTCFITQFVYIFCFTTSGIPWISILFFVGFGTNLGFMFVCPKGENDVACVISLAEILLFITFTPTLMFNGWWIFFSEGFFISACLFEELFASAERVKKRAIR